MKFLQWLTAKLYCLIDGHVVTRHQSTLNWEGGPLVIEHCERCDRSWIVD